MSNFFLFNYYIKFSLKIILTYLQKNLKMRQMELAKIKFTTNLKFKL